MDAINDYAFRFQFYSSALGYDQADQQQTLRAFAHGLRPPFLSVAKLLLRRDSFIKLQPFVQQLVHHALVLREAAQATSPQRFGGTLNSVSRPLHITRPVKATAQADVPTGDICSRCHQQGHHASECLRRNFSHPSSARHSTFGRFPRPSLAAPQPERAAPPAQPHVTSPAGQVAVQASRPHRVKYSGQEPQAKLLHALRHDLANQLVDVEIPSDVPRMASSDIKSFVAELDPGANISIINEDLPVKLGLAVQDSDPFPLPLAQPNRPILVTKKLTHQLPVQLTADAIPHLECFYVASPGPGPGRALIGTPVLTNYC